MDLQKVKLKVYAKVNLSLNILGLCGGMHELDMVTASASIADAVTVSKRRDNLINVEFSNFSAPLDNTAYRMAAILQNGFGITGADIFIEKGIPAEAGLGGSSADAAAVLFALDKLYGLSSCGLDIKSEALKAGSDVPLMYYGGYLRVKGTGGSVEPIPSGLCIDFVICKGAAGVSTKSAYQKFDELYSDKMLISADNETLTDALKKNDLLKTAKLCGNALTAPALNLEPSVKESIDALKKAGAVNAFMTGSGSACVGIFENSRKALSAQNKILKKGLWAKACTTVSRGIEIV